MPRPATRSGCRSDRSPAASRRPGRARRDPLRRARREAGRASPGGGRGDGSRGPPLLRSQAPHRSLETDLVLPGPAIGEPDPGRAASRTGSGDTGGILVLLALGLTFRLIIAYLLPGS